MDKLPEPSFENDPKWPRKRLGAEEMLKQKKSTATKIFYVLAGLSLFRYYREITFYQHNYSKFLFLIVPTFLFSSYALGQLKIDSYVYAANLNNQNEEEYIRQYRDLWKEAKRKNIQLPDNLIL
jgi:hypothetical protein